MDQITFQNVSSTSASNGSLIDQKLLDIIVSQTLCSLNWSALIKTEPSELLTLAICMLVSIR